MSMQIGRPVSPPVMPSTPSESRISRPAVSEVSVQSPKAPQNTQESYGAVRQSVIGRSSELVNPSQGGQQIKQGLDQADGGQIAEQAQRLMESPKVRQEFGNVSSTPPKSQSSIPPPPPPPKKSASVSPHSVGASLTPEMLLQARQNLKQVSQYQVLNLGDMSTGSTSKESAVSRKLGSEVGGVPLDKDRLPGADGSIDIVGHSSDGGMQIEGKSPQQLAKLLKDNFGLQQIKNINLVSCGSEQFIAEFQQALSGLGVEVGEVTGAKGRVAVDRATGKTLDEAVTGDLSKISGHDGALMLRRTTQYIPLSAGAMSAFPLLSGSMPAFPLLAGGMPTFPLLAGGMPAFPLLAGGLPAVPLSTGGMSFGSMSDVMSQPPLSASSASSAGMFRTTRMNFARKLTPQQERYLQEINGRYPINAEYAGDTFKFRPASKLGKKYPKGVEFSKKGFPDFSLYVKEHKNRSVVVDVGKLDPGKGPRRKGGSQRDMQAANTRMRQLDPNWRQPPGYTWHHVENSTKLQLVPTDIHAGVRHSGGRSTYDFGKGRK